MQCWQSRLQGKLGASHMQLVALLSGLRLFACLGLLPAAVLLLLLYFPSALQETVMGRLEVLRV